MVDDHVSRLDHVVSGALSSAPFASEPNSTREAVPPIRRQSEDRLRRSRQLGCTGCRSAFGIHLARRRNGAGWSGCMLTMAAGMTGRASAS